MVSLKRRFGPQADLERDGPQRLSGPGPKPMVADPGIRSSATNASGTPSSPTSGLVSLLQVAKTLESRDFRKLSRPMKQVFQCRTRFMRSNGLRRQ
ncbi:hypothetical protein PI125_g17613 [Phytophthora idaei]|nr:hypothetical protein PI125_g17613 [Phytophthora idaei]